MSPETLSHLLLSQNEFLHQIEPRQDTQRGSLIRHSTDFRSTSISHPPPSQQTSMLSSYPRSQRNYNNTSANSYDAYSPRTTDSNSATLLQRTSYAPTHNLQTLGLSTTLPMYTQSTTLQNDFQGTQIQEQFRTSSSLPPPPSTHRRTNSRYS